MIFTNEDFLSHFVIYNIVDTHVDHCSFVIGLTVFHTTLHILTLKRKIRLDDCHGRR